MSTELHAAVTALAEAAQRFTDTGGTDHQAADPLADMSSQIESLTQQVAQAQATVDEFGARVSDGLAAFQVSASSEAQGAAQSIDELLGEIDQCFDLAEQALNDAARGFDTAADDVAEALDMHAEAWRAGAQDTLMRGLEQGYDSAIADADDAQRQALAAQVSQLDDALEAQLALLLGALDAVREALTDALDGSQAQRAATQPALDAVDAVMDPLMEQVERVKDLASSVGISV